MIHPQVYSTLGTMVGGAKDHQRATENGPVNDANKGTWHSPIQCRAMLTSSVLLNPIWLMPQAYQ